MKKYFLSVLVTLSVGHAAPGFAQQTTLVKPRQYTLLSSQLMTNKQAINTNAALPGQNIGVFTNTLTAFSGSHPVGLTAIIGSTNNLAGSSNVVVAVYPAYDNNGGNSSSIGVSYGTNFATVPIFTNSLKPPHHSGSACTTESVPACR